MIQSYFHSNNNQHPNDHRDDDDDFSSSNISKRTRLHEDPEVELELQKVRANPSKYPAPPIPSPPVVNPTMSVARQLNAIQRYINAFEYNHTGLSFFRMRRDRGMKHLVYTAKVIIRECLPIQCVEALFLAVHLTNKMTKLIRIPVSFRSSVDGQEHCHIVLAVKSPSFWGALGISRLSNLMYKPFRYKSLADLVIEFIQSYKNYFHNVLEISFGLPFSHDNISESPLVWKVLRLTLDDNKRKFWEEHKDAIIMFERDSPVIFDYLSQTGQVPEWCDEMYKKGLSSCKLQRK